MVNEKDTHCIVMDILSLIKDKDTVKTVMGFEHTKAITLLAISIDLFTLIMNELIQTEGGGQKIHNAIDKISDKCKLAEKLSEIDPKSN